VERLFGTLQDRLVKELRRAGAATLEEADRALQKYLPRFNARFAQEPADPDLAYLQSLDPEAVFCFKHQRMVRNDNTISFSGHPLQIPPDRHRASYARCRVEVRQQLDGRLSIAYQERVLISFAPEQLGPPRQGKFSPASKPARKIPKPKPAKRRPAKPKSRQPWKPPADHPWRKPFKIAAESPRVSK
jgi:hypothetical protein